MSHPPLPAKSPHRPGRDTELKDLRTRLLRMIADREAQKHVDKKVPHPA